jgi:hypothetical protein
LEIGKWSEKKEALDAAISEFSVPKIVPREHYHLISLLKKLLVDSNVAIQICGMKLCRALANGLRRSFSHASKVLSPLLLLKLRDKKPQILDESHKTLKSFSHSITL